MVFDREWKDEPMGSTETVQYVVSWSQAPCDTVVLQRVDYWDPESRSVNPPIQNRMETNRGSDSHKWYRSRCRVVDASAGDHQTETQLDRDYTKQTPNVGDNVNIEPQCGDNRGHFLTSTSS